MNINKKYLLAHILFIAIGIALTYSYIFINAQALVQNKAVFYCTITLSACFFLLGVISFIIALCKKIIINMNKEGVGFSFKLKELSIGGFFKVISPLIRDLRDLPCEHLIIDFEDNCRAINFIQTAKYDNVYMLEIGTIFNNKHKLFRLQKQSLSEVKNWFFKVCVLEEDPDLTKWEEVSHLCK